MQEESGPAVPAQVEDLDDTQPTEAAELRIFLMPVSRFRIREWFKRTIARLWRGTHSARPEANPGPRAGLRALTARPSRTAQSQGSTALNGDNRDPGPAW